MRTVVSISATRSFPVDGVLPLRYHRLNGINCPLTERILLDGCHPGIEIDRLLNDPFDGLTEGFVLLLDALESAIGFRIDADCFCGRETFVCVRVLDRK